MLTDRELIAAIRRNREGPMPDTPDREAEPCCQNCGKEITLGKYRDGVLCFACRVALGPEPEGDSWAEWGE